MPISKLPALFELVSIIISIILFIGSSALLYRSRYDKNQTLVAIAGVVAFVAFGYFVADLLGVRSSPSSPSSPPTISDYALNRNKGWPPQDLSEAEIKRIEQKCAWHRKMPGGGRFELCAFNEIK